MRKPTLLIFVEYFLPGYKWGGPIQSVANLIGILHPHYDISIVTRDRDFLDVKPYPAIVNNEWLIKENYRIMYCSPDLLTRRLVYTLARSPAFDFVYANSLFGKLSHGLLLLSWLTGRHIVIAPRGELQPGALRLKYYKKYPFVRIVKAISRGQITWHATNEAEQKAIRQLFPASRIGIAPVVLAPDTPRQLQPRLTYQKQAGLVKLVFIARITPVKGLLFLFEILASIRDLSIELDIFGPIDNESYWRSCQNVLAKLTPNCSATYRGVLAHPLVNATLRNYDFFILPTHSESFGHSIFEALSVGVPVIISDQTPWQQLVLQQAGWDIPLQKQHWLSVLKQAVDMGDDAYTTLSEGARSIVEKYVNEQQLGEKYRLLFS
ncbi:glycosyltransferase [Spirosoma sp. BT702]|uniref:Glycosyltransferase n=1 Tax=Spirosoma profusum TaxID=2771354 RepID=A0A927G9N6_9BACT|nr:glycosyltransferase [Spirosoma profusum]MBD2704797.1 glycosyltransferase [Spirosoma profusum]